MGSMLVILFFFGFLVIYGSFVWEFDVSGISLVFAVIKEVGVEEWL